MSATAATLPPLLRIRGLGKTFPGQVALAGVDLDIRPGEVHALVGQNGSGKSTLIKILAGFHEPDPGGSVEFGSDQDSFGGDEDGGDRRIAFVHQDLALVGALDATDNLALGRGFQMSGGRIDRRAERERAAGVLSQLGADIPLDRPLEQLRPVERSLIAIARALDGLTDSAVLVLDEPTAALPAPEVDRLFDAIRRVTLRGGAVLYVSHRLDEVFSVADRVTVLRDGRLVATTEVAELDHDGLIELMFGHGLSRETRQVQSLSPDARTVLEIRSMRGRTIEDFSVRLRAGEIVGVAGLAGSGREDLAASIVGAVPGTHGEVIVDGEPLRRRTPRSAIDAGVALVPADRPRLGAILEHTVAENVTLPKLRPLMARLRIQRRREHDEVLSLSERLELRPADPQRRIGTLSGGNQQKAVLARWLRVRPRALIVDEPTQGVDVGAKERIHDVLRSAAAQGLALLVCTAETEDLPGLCNRVLVLRGGRVVAELSGRDLTTERILAETLDPPRKLENA
ncbi:sugar ABC transporter ATP-binding protein [Streptomyces mirabilis]|uniref:sugar ABC transporter ATP-binding protein n=1 Tax=Streptomyces mirabilis TaxID=68239 RepID=UPI0036CEB852